MANWVLTSWSQQGDYDSVLAAMETKLETVDNGKTIVLSKLIPRGKEFVGVLLYET